MAVTTLRFDLLDNDGQPATTQYYLDGAVTDVDDAGVSAIQDAVNGMSDAAVSGINLGVSDYASIGAAAANAYDAADKAEVFWRDTAGQEGSFSIPDPDDGVFSGDFEDVDISAGAGATLKAAIEVLVKGPSGAAVVVKKITRYRFTRQR